MAVSKEWPPSHEWNEWHLTPRGWESGSDKSDGRGEILRPPPLDRALTFRFHEAMMTMHAKIDRWFSKEWRDSDYFRINALLNKFGPCPEQL